MPICPLIPEVYDARGQATINDAPKLAKYKDLAGNPDVAIVFTPKVWSPGGGINAFVGGQRAKKDDDGNPVDKTQWSVSLSFVSITLLGHSGGGVPDMAQTPKKARRV